MNSNLLDDGEVSTGENFDRLNWIPMLLLWVGAVVQLIINYESITISQWISIFVLVVCTILFYNRSRHWLMTFTVILFCWMVLIVTFPFPFSLSYELLFGKFAIGIEIIIGLIFFLHCFLNRKELFGKAKNNSPKENVATAASVRKFKHRFAQKSDEELTKILEENRLVPAALSAAKELLAERS